MTIEIPLTHGFKTIVDDADVDLASLKWHSNNGIPSNTYAVRAVYPNGRNGGKVRVWMHRLILERAINRTLIDGEKADHINGNPLDNRRENLRVATIANNSQNKRLSSNNKSGFKGVRFHKGAGKWVSKIGYNRTYKHLGTFDTPEAAYEAYCKAGRELHGEFFNPG